MKKIFYLQIVFLSLGLSNVFAQKIDPKNYDKFIDEVYGGTEYMTQELKDIYIKNMAMVEVKKWDGENYPFLEERIDLVNKYNPSLKYDIGKDFNNNLFNPLKYFFNFTTKQVLRVRNTDYMIVVDPQ
jgi:hypothetical protein